MAIVGAVIGLGRSLGMVTVAEGVESEEQLEIIRAAGVSQAQGYLLGKPCPNALFNRLAGKEFGEARQPAEI